MSHLGELVNSECLTTSLLNAGAGSGSETQSGDAQFGNFEEAVFHVSDDMQIPSLNTSRTGYHR
jgi:hypothetical protein